MKVAFTVNTQAENPSLERRFGRCPYFLVVDTETQKRTLLSNPGLDSPHGAGTQAAQFLVGENIEAVISGDIGPNAYAVLNAAGVEMFSAGMGQVDALLADFQAGNLQHAISRGGRGRGRRR
jgi:predicted Fe-Mo cluster-binding NifX family protein